MEDQRFGASLADPLPQTGSIEEISGDLGFFLLGDVPGHYFSAPDVNHQVEVQPDAAHAGGQVGDVRAPDVVRPSGLQPRHRTGFLGRPGAAPGMGLSMVMEQAIEAALRTDVQATIRKNRHDLPRRQRRELALVAGEQDPLAHLHAEAMGHQAVAAFRPSMPSPSPANCRRQRCSVISPTPSSIASSRARATVALAASRVSRASRRTSAAGSPTRPRPSRP